MKKDLLEKEDKIDLRVLETKPKSYGKSRSDKPARDWKEKKFWF
jgi:hypothetical protein